MAVLVGLTEVTARHEGRTLFEGVSLGIQERDRVGLVGPNGAGKSTLVRLLAGIDSPDEGTRSVVQGCQIAIVPQSPTFEPDDTVESVLAAALAHEPCTPKEVATRVARTMGRTGFSSGDLRVGTLSGGWKKRLAIARALVTDPSVVLFDEPTNHLDLEGVLWLERLLEGIDFAFLAVSHDRWFLENVADRMIELNPVHPGGSFSVEGSYTEFLMRRDETLTARAKYHESLANKVRREVEWLRRGAKARSTKSTARIDQAHRMIDELADHDQRSQVRRAQVAFDGSGRRTKQLVVMERVTKAMGGKTLFRNLDLVLSPGQRLGVMGLNGSGKTTLLRLICNELDPDQGTVRFAEHVQVVRFDQEREELDPELTLRRALAPSGGDAVIYRGSEVHVAGWARKFLFRTEQLDAPVGRLSGGEQARVLIARLMLRPADVLVLDEPTNDLDLPTLEVLEDTLLEFPGALVLVTHDRYMLDRISNQLLALDGEGNAQPFADYAQWEAFQRSATRRDSPARSSPSGPAGSVEGAVPTGVAKRGRLSYNEQRELETMEQRIAEAEAEVERLHVDLSDPEVAADAAELTRLCAQMQEAQETVARLYARWEDLEARKPAS